MLYSQQDKILVVGVVISIIISAIAITSRELVVSSKVAAFVVR